MRKKDIKSIVIGILCLALCITGIPINLMPLYAEETSQNNTVDLENDGYVYGKNMSTNSVTLVAELKSGTVNTAEWSRSIEKNGTYTSIQSLSGATFENKGTMATLTLNESALGSEKYWYKCNINGVETKEVQLVKAKYDSSGTKGNGAYINVLNVTNGQWYVSNGTMAYSVWARYEYFDVIGQYTKDGTGYWINTSYGTKWEIGTSSSDSPAGTDCSSLQTSLDAFRCSFDENDIHRIAIEAKLASDQKAISFGADVMLATSTVTQYADNASLKAIYDTGSLNVKSIQMVGAESVDKAELTDPAFVLHFTDTPSSYWLGFYSSRQHWSYCTDGSGIKDTKTLADGTKVVSEVAGIDSGMTASWKGLSAGATVRFSFGVGSVEEAGATISATTTANTITIENADDSLEYAVYGENGESPLPLYDAQGNELKDSQGKSVYWISPTDGVVKFYNLQSNTKYSVRTRKKGTTDVNQEKTDITTNIDPTKPEKDQKPVVCTPGTTNLKFENLNKEYTYQLQTADGTAVNRTWKSTTDGNITFDSLHPGVDYYLIAKTSSNTKSDRVKYTTNPTKIHFDANVEGEQVEVPADITEKCYGKSVQLPSESPKRENYQFAGWCLHADGSGTIFPAGSSYNENSDQDQTLYAIWHKHVFSAKWSSDETNHWHACTGTPACNVRLDEEKHTESGWIIDKAATKSEEGKKHIECTVCKRVLKEETIPKITKTESDYLTAAKQAAEDAIRETPASNEVTKENLENAVREAFANAGIPDSVQWKLDGFQKTDATKTDTGKITANITITSGNEQATVSVDKIIAKLEQTEQEKTEQVKKEIEEKLPKIPSNNNSNEEDVQNIIQKMLEENGLTTDDVTIKNFQKQDATTEVEGKISGTAEVKIGDQIVEIPFSQTIPKLPKDDAETVTGAGKLLKDHMSDLKVNESSSDKNQDLIQQIENLLKQAGYTDCDINIEDVTITDPTDEADGEYSAAIIIRKGEEVQEISFSQTLPQLGKTDKQKLDHAQQVLENVMQNTILGNQNTTWDLVNDLTQNLQNAGLSDVTIVTPNLTKQDATAQEEGSITGTVIIKSGEETREIPVHVVLPKIAETAEDKISQAESVFNQKLADILVSNETDQKKLLEEMRELLEKAGLSDVQIENKNLEKTEATVTSAGAISGTITIKAEDQEKEFVIHKIIPKIPGTDEEQVKEAAVLTEARKETFMHNNETTEDTLKAEIEQMLKQAGISGVSVDIKSWNKTPASYENEGEITGTVVYRGTDGSEQEVEIRYSIPKLIKTDAQKAAEAKTKLEEALKQITWGNETSLDEIKKELQKTADADGATVDTTGLTITPATSKNNGSVTGSIKVTVGTQTVEIPVEQVIPKLNKTPEEKVAEAKTEAKEFLPNLTVSNDSTEESILKDLQDQLQKAGLADVTVTIDPFEIIPATTDTVGHITGTVTVEKDGKKESFSFEKLISKLPKDDTQKTAKAKNIIVSQLDDSIIKNSTTPEELQQKLKEELQKSGMSDVELTVSDLQKTPATKEKDGTVTGTITVRCGDQEIQIPVSEKIPYEMTPEENAQMVKKVVEEKVKTITVNNATTKDSIIEELQKELEKAGVQGAQLELKQFNKTNATTKKAGSVSGTVIAIVGEKVYEIPVKEEIPKLDKSDSETVKDAKKLVQDICNSKNADGFQAVNSTTKETLQEVLKEQLKNAGMPDVDVSVDKLEKKPATSEKEGSITATVRITSGNTKSEFKVTFPIQKIATISTSTDGKFTVEGTEKNADAPKTELDSTIDDIKDAIPNIKPDENVNVYLKVEQQPKEPEKKEQQKIQTVAEKEGVTVEQYVDISLFKRVTSGDTEDITKLSELNKKVKLSIVVPENLRTTDKNVIRTYMLIHYHDGEAEAELVEGEYDAATYTFTFSTDKFSTYAIAYKDTTKNESGTSSGETEIPAKTNQEILALAKTSAQQTLNRQKVTNATTKEEIAQAVEKALAAENNTKNVSTEVISFTKVAATTKKEGSISGTIKLTINGVTEEVPFSYTIAKLSKGDSADNSGKEKFPYMIATASSAKVGNKQVGMSWKKVKDADGYEVYASTCDGKNNFKRVTDTKKLSFTHKKLSNSKAYKYYVRAYKLVNGKKVYLKKTVTIHVALKEQKYTNAKAVTLSKKSYAMKAGQKAQIKAKTVKENAKKKLLTHTAEFRYYTDNSEIAVVSKNGKITAKKAGTCTIYVMANNGVYNTAKVTVK